MATGPVQLSLPSSVEEPTTEQSYTEPVPTTRPRVVVTETDELAGALDDAARRWPGESRSALLVRLALAGHRAAQGEHADSVRRRMLAIERWDGAFSDGYDPNLLADLREGWPE